MAIFFNFDLRASVTDDDASSTLFSENLTFTFNSSLLIFLGETVTLASAIGTLNVTS